MEKMLGRGRGGGSVLCVERHRLLPTVVLSLTAYKYISKPSLDCAAYGIVHAGGPGLFGTTGLQNEKLIR